MKEQSGSMLSIVNDGDGYDVYINGTAKDSVDMLYQLAKNILELLEIETEDLLLFLAIISHETFQKQHKKEREEKL